MDAIPQYTDYTLWRSLISRDKINYTPSGKKPLMTFATKLINFTLQNPKNNRPGIVVYIPMAESVVVMPTKDRQLGTKNLEQMPKRFLPFIEHVFDETTLKFRETAIQ